jgi:hypothetical protein
MHVDLRAFAAQGADRTPDGEAGSFPHFRVVLAARFRQILDRDRDGVLDLMGDLGLDVAVEDAGGRAAPRSPSG